MLTRDAGVGKSAIIKSDMAVSQHFMAWQCGPLLDNHFLYYWLQAAKPEFERIAMGNTIKTIGLPYFRTFRVPRPSILEQRAIATGLSDVDALLAKLDQLIAKKRDLKQATMQQLLTGQTRLPGFNASSTYKQTELGKIPSDWAAIPLGDMIRLQGGYAFKSNDFSDIGVPIIRISDIQDGVIEIDETICHPPIKLSDDFVIHQGDVLVAMSGATTGKVGLYRSAKPAYLNQRVGKFVIRDNARTSSCFIEQLVRSSLFISRLSVFLEQGAQPNISGSQIESLVFATPRELGEQTAIATILSDMDAEIAALEARRDKTKDLKLGMMQELLTGRIRLA